MIFSEQNENVSKAWAKAWGELNNPKHNKTVKVQTKSGGSYSFDYTDLGGIFDEGKDPLKDNGLSVSQSNFSEVIDGQLYVCVQTTFIHETGEWMKSGILRVKASQNIQDMGGQQTYLRRYQLSGMLGISTEEDDDANGVSGNSYDMKDKKQPKASDKQLNLVDNLLKKKINDDYPTKESVFDFIVEYYGLPKDMTSWTKKQASHVIEKLQDKKGA